MLRLSRFERYGKKSERKKGREREREKICRCEGARK
jgi:hypothetical protein